MVCMFYLLTITGELPRTFKNTLIIADFQAEMPMTISSAHGLHCAFIGWYGLVSTSIYPLSACGGLNLGTDRQQNAT